MKFLARFVDFLNYHRRVVAAVCAAICVGGVISALEGRPLQGTPVVALARAVSPGEALTPDDLTMTELPDEFVTPHTVQDLSGTVGAVTLVAGDAGSVLDTHSLLQGTSARAGHSLVPIAIPDDDLRALLHPGQTVALIASFGGSTETLTDKARILRLPAPGGDAAFGAAAGRFVLVEVPNAVAHDVATLGQTGQLSVILHSNTP